jgi:4-diphosphocytidyl-2-C-methyl-D-erythritol kinase
MTIITATAPAKVNLVFEVGPLKSNGYHDVNTLFLALDLREEVTVSKALPGTGISIFVKGDGLPSRHLAAVPTDSSNLVAKVAVLLSQKLDIETPDIQIDILKRIPVAGGMAGGSADAAAMLVAFNEYAHQEFGTAKLSTEELMDVAAELGSDISFCVLGQLAVGTGRGEQLQSVTPFPFETHWVLAISQQGLSTPSVYAKFDELGALPNFSDLMQVSGSIISLDALGLALSNGLQDAALALMPQLESLIEEIEGLGALRAIVSGSGPTIAALCYSKDQAMEIAKTLNERGIFALTAGSPALGANLEA